MNETNTPSPFVKWAGGKSQLLDQYEEFFPPSCKSYYEPFVGGGAVFFFLRRRDNFAKWYCISDANEELVLTYQVVRDLPEELLEELRLFELRHRRDGKAYYLKVREWDRSSGFGKRTKVSRAARLIYLNRTCFNGLWRVNSNGQFNVPMGSYNNPTIYDVERIHQASMALQGVEIRQEDFEKAVQDAGEGDFVYFDPPYVPLNVTSSFTNYHMDGFGLEEQKRLANLFSDLHNRGCMVMLSNSDTEIVYDLFNGLGIRSLNINNQIYARRQINSDSDGRGEITEVLITNY